MICKYIFILFSIFIIGCDTPQQSVSPLKQPESPDISNCNVIFFLTDSISADDFENPAVTPTINKLKTQSCVFTKMCAVSDNSLSNIFSALLSQYLNTHKIINTSTIQGTDSNFIPQYFSETHNTAALQWGHPLMPRHVSKMNQFLLCSPEITVEDKTIFGAADLLIESIREQKPDTPFFITFTEYNTIPTLYWKLHKKIYGNSGKAHYTDSAFGYLLKQTDSLNRFKTMIIFLSTRTDPHKIPYLPFLIQIPDISPEIYEIPLSIIDISPALCQMFRIDNILNEGYSFFNLFSGKDLIKKRPGLIYQTPDSIHCIIKNYMFSVSIPDNDFATVSGYTFEKFEKEIVEKKIFNFFDIHQNNTMTPVPELVKTTDMLKEYSFPVYQWLRGFKK